MRILGVDPGKDGALVLLDESGKILQKWKTPLVKSSKAKDEYDLPAIRDIFYHSKPQTIAIEKTQPLPPKMGGSAANFQRGFAGGLYQGICVGLGMSYALVAARTWQKVMFADVTAADTKAASIIVAKRIWPNEDWRRSEKAKKNDDGLTDAALMAEFARRALHLRTAVAAQELGLI